ncbi:MAG: polymerase ECF-type sigma factor [Myxococcales bacterium]|nr:polymerase ECF-type sigma factor [Myxococcales bacterium]
MSAAETQERFLQALATHQKIVYKVARLYCAIEADRQELTQEIVVQLWRSFERFDGRSKLSTWMYRVALNVAISFVRDQVRRTRPTVPLDEALLELSASAVAGEAAGGADERVVAELLARLGELDRALVLLYLEGHGQEAIGEILGLSTTNVSTKLGRIKERLRDEMKEVG